MALEVGSVSRGATVWDRDGVLLQRRPQTHKDADIGLNISGAHAAAAAAAAASSSHLRERCCDPSAVGTTCCIDTPAPCGCPHVCFLFPPPASSCSSAPCLESWEILRNCQPGLLDTLATRCRAETAPSGPERPETTCACQASCLSTLFRGTRSQIYSRPLSRNRCHDGDATSLRCHAFSCSKAALARHLAAHTRAHRSAGRSEPLGT
jgi:hypothetical protein